MSKRFFRIHFLLAVAGLVASLTIGTAPAEARGGRALQAARHVRTVIRVTQRGPKSYSILTPATTRITVRVRSASRGLPPRQADCIQRRRWVMTPAGYQPRMTRVCL